MSRVKIISRALAFVMTMQFLGDGAIVFAQDNTNGKNEQKSIVSKEMSDTLSIKNVTLNKTQFKPGETLIISADFDGEITKLGICSAYMYLQAGHMSEGISVDMKYNESNNKIEGRLEITEDMKYKNLYLNYIDIYDKEGNYINYWSNDGGIENIKITDSNGNIDVNKPQFHSFDLNKNEASVGEIIKATVRCTDDLSGVELVGITIKDGIGFYEHIEAKNINGEFVADIVVKEEQEGRSIFIDGINIVDKAGNNEYIMGWDLENNCIFIANKDGQIDKVPPVINSANFNKSQVKVGENITFEVNASDDVSGVNSGYIWIDIDGHSERKELIYNENTKKLECDIAIEQKDKYKTIRVTQVEVYDKSCNITTQNYDWDNSPKVNIADENGEVDNVGPKFNSLSLSSNKLNVGDTLIVGIGATDNLSGIKEVQIGYSYGDSWNNDWGCEYNPKTDKYEFKINITEEMKYKKIEIENVNIRDNAGNYTFYNFTEEDNNIAYVVGENGVIDTNPPVINNITYSHNQTIGIGEVLKITVSASDAETAVKGATLNYEIGNEWISGVEATYNSSTGNYEFNITIKAEDVYKNISINNIKVKDMADNYSEKYDYIRLSVKDSDGIIDAVEPVYLGGSFDKSIYSVGDTITLSIEASDELSGVNRVSANILNGPSNVFEDFILNKSTGKYEYKIKVDNDMIYNKVEIESINIYDNAGNNIYIHNTDINIKPVYVQDINGNIDTVAPVLLGFESDKKTVKVGETVTYSVRASDNLSGISQVEVQYNIPGIDIWRNETLSYNSITKKYEFTLDITSEMLYKKIVINNIIIKDEAGNRTVINKENISLKDVVVVDETGIVDTEAPIFNNVTVSNQVVKPGEKLGIYVDATDSGLGIEKVNISINTPTLYKEIVMKYDESTKKYFAEIDILEEWVYKKINVSNISIVDRAGNLTSVYNSDQLQNGWVNVADKNGLYDDETPKLVSIDFNKKYVMAGDTIKVLAKVTDNLSGVSFVNYSYIIGSEYKSIELEYNSNTGLYEGTIQLSKEDKYKKIMSTSVYLCDNAGNYGGNYNISDVVANITDENGEYDVQAPKVYTITFNKEYVKPGEAVRVSAKVDDDRSGVKEVRLSYSILGDYNYVIMEYNPVTKLYEVDITTDISMKDTIISIEGIDVKDNSENSNYFYNIRKVIYIGDKAIQEDNEGPKFIKGTVSKTTAKVGDTVTISVEATDDSGINFISAYFEPFKFVFGYEEDSFVELIYNPTTKKYEGELTIKEYMKGAKLYVGSIDMLDNRNNYTTVMDERINNMTILVPDENGQIDTTPPILEDYYVSNNQAKVGEKVKVFFKIKDNNPLREVSVYYNDDDSFYEEVKLTFNKDSGLYEGELKIEPYMESSMLIANYLTIMDKGGNVISPEQYDRDGINKLNIKVADINGNFDNLAPELKSYGVIEYDYSQYIELKCSDLGSGVRSGEIVYERENGEEVTCYLLPDIKEGSLLLDYKYMILEYKHEKLTVKKVIIRDAVKNEKVYYGNDKDFSSINIVGKDYVQYKKGDVVFKTINPDSKEIVGKTIYKNHIVRLFLRNSVVDEVKSDANGNFKFNLDYYWQDYNVLIQVIDPITKKYVAYEKKEVARNVDFDRSGKVDILDLSVVSAQYGKTYRNYGFEERLDVNWDEQIDLYDLVYVARLMD